MDIVLYEVVVEGRVQGVWFRRYTFNKAKSLGLKGFVENKLNNSVYIEVEGTLEELKEFVNWLQIGSPLSKVTSVNYSKKELKNYKRFEVRP